MLPSLVRGSFAGDKLRKVELPSSNRWARTLPREAARGLADAMPVSCQVQESRSSLCYKKKVPLNPLTPPIGPRPSDGGNCCELRKLCNGFLASVQSLQCLNSTRVSLCAPPLLILKVSWPLLC